MKLTTAAVLAFVAALAFANPVPYEETAVYARNLYERDGGEGSLGSFHKRGGDVTSLFKSLAGAAGSMGGRTASNSAQYGISKSISPSTYATQSTPKHPPQSLTHHQKPHLRRHRRHRPPQPSLQPPSLEEGTMRRGLSTRLESLEKRRRGKAKDPSMFKSFAGAVGSMGGRAASTSVQLGLLTSMIPPAPPPPLPMARRGLRGSDEPTTSRSSFAPFRAIKNAFTRTSQTTARVYRNSAPARKWGKNILIAFMDGATDGIAKPSSNKKN